MGKPARSELILLVEALLNGDIKAVLAQLLAAKSVDLRLPQRKNRPARETPLMLAAETGALPVLRLLISLGADPNATNAFRQPPLLYAVRKNQTAAANLLLKSGADANLRMLDGDFVLREAAVAGIDLRISRALIKHGADPCLANKRGSTALHIAAFGGRADVARLLIRAGADVNHRDRHGLGPLTCAISRNRTEMVTLLVQQGADPRLQPEALGMAAWEGKTEVVQMLIENEWDIHSKAYQGRTPLQHAQNRKHQSVIQTLMRRGAGS